MQDFDLGSIQMGSSGLDAFLADDPPKRVTAGCMKIRSLQQLRGFKRVAEDTLVHLATKDLWTLRKDGEDFVVERLFQDSGPLKEMP